MISGNLIVSNGKHFTIELPSKFKVERVEAVPEFFLVEHDFY